MSKKVKIQTINNAGQTFGQKARSQDITQLQDFAHEHTETATNDFLTAERTVAGFDFAFPDNFSNTRQITILAPGRVYETDGKQFELAANITLTIADSAIAARIDAIVAVVEANYATANEVMPFVRIRTQAELDAGAVPYPPTQLNAPTQAINRAVVQLKQGVPGENYSPPVLAPNEVLLYLVNVAGNTDALRKEDIVDMRNRVRRLSDLNDDVAGVQGNLNAAIRRIAKLENEIGNQQIDLTPIFGRITTLSELFTLLKNQVDTLGLSNPEILRPKLSLLDPNYGKLDAVGNVDGGSPVVDIELGSTIRFGNKEVVLDPSTFPLLSNARFAQISGGGNNVRRETDLTLANVTLIDADGTSDFALRNAQLGAARSHPATAARDGRFVEIFGGLAANNDDALGDWITYDTVNDSLAARGFSGDIPPNSDRPAMFPCGNGDILLCCAGGAGNPRWFRFNATTGVCDEKTGTRPVGVHIFGDLIAPNRIFIVAVEKTLPGAVPHFWEYNVTTDTFSELGVTGNTPKCEIDYSGGCTVQQGKFVVVDFEPGVSSSGKTYIFDYASLTFNQLFVPPPYLEGIDKELPISRFRMANINGKATLVGGLLVKPTDPTFARIWELIAKPTTGTGYEWRAVDTSFSPSIDTGFCSTIREGLGRGGAFMIAGHGKVSDALQRIYASTQGGLIATTLDGLPAITLADTTTYAVFAIPDYIAPWDVGAFYANIAGKFVTGEVVLEASFDDGVNWAKYPLDNTTIVTDSTNPAKRKLRITIYAYSKSKPILRRLTEIFDADGIELDDRIVLRYNPNTLTEVYLYVNNEGIVSIEDNASPSTPDKCLLQKVKSNGVAVAPTVVNFVNKRRARMRVSQISDDTPATLNFDNELAAEVGWVEAFAISSADGILYRIPTPVVGFNAGVTIAGSGVGVEIGDTWVVELEA